MTNLRPVSPDIQEFIESDTKSAARTALDVHSRSDISTIIGKVSVQNDQPIPPGESRFFNGVILRNPTSEPLLPTSPQITTTTSLKDLDFKSAVNNAGDTGSSVIIDLSIGFNHIFNVTESVLISADNWVEGASFTIDLINTSDDVFGLSWQNFDFLADSPIEILGETRQVYTGKCVLSVDGSEQYYQIALVGNGGSI